MTDLPVSSVVVNELSALIPDSQDADERQSPTVTTEGDTSVSPRLVTDLGAGVSDRIVRCTTRLRKCAWRQLDSDSGGWDLVGWHPVGVGLM
eukprot:CAMPEP_0198119850 /NCGR_PEP_ID=MMETSP1442-20131203/27248_1 /TAXON_ID= /ORGANISM="Craspedostauros australis, Strain CCMP3328" /LENGTH=91 /DNA_ID=CAMNT_0043778405 /DNA_START=387 /DNA_END=663 /DNA_ORIENTATION=+